MGVKNNFSQAVSELIGMGKNAGESEKMMDPLEEPVGQDEEEIGQSSKEEEDGVKEEASENVITSKEKILAMLSQQHSNQQSQSQPQAQPQPQAKAEGTSIRVSQPQAVTVNQGPKPEPGVTTIAYGTVIVGEIHAEGDLELLGSVKGKVTSQGDIRVNGKVVGDLEGKDINLEACAVQGNIIASGFVNVDGESLVIGDVKCESFSLDGKIKGNVTVEKEAKFQPKAILSGNVTTASIAMSQGAKIQGEVNIPLSEKDTDMSFDVEITI